MVGVVRVGPKFPVFSLSRPSFCFFFVFPMSEVFRGIAVVSSRFHQRSGEEKKKREILDGGGAGPVGAGPGGAGTGDPRAETSQKSGILGSKRP